ncbi:hypothetical protein ABT324_02170 [Saccharopolyspora sp. NPDC000359]|uniref:hypothetical protein n=1 Tax=Saccharopolyspora sp. NPDC000359 TaxID=3154251 RepID=UPI00331AF728
MDTPAPQRMLEIYLNDHLAAATGGLALARRAARSNRDAEVMPRLAEIALEVDQDRRALLKIMRKLDVRVARTKVVLGWAAEKAGRLKFNGSVRTRSPLSVLVEVEALCLGVQGKAAGWRTLLAFADHDARLATDILQDLVNRAQHQFEVLERIRVQMASDIAARPQDRGASAPNAAEHPSTPENTTSSS